MNTSKKAKRTEAEEATSKGTRNTLYFCPNSNKCYKLHTNNNIIRSDEFDIQQARFDIQHERRRVDRDRATKQSTSGNPRPTNGQGNTANP